MIRRAKNLYCLDQAFEYEHPALLGVSFWNDWCAIVDGRILVHEGYAWDGCSPKYELAARWVVGVPDGRLQEGVPITYHASLVHDVFCQFRDQIPITKSAVVKIFNDMLADRGFGARLLYVSAVDWLGPQQFAGDRV